VGPCPEWAAFSAGGSALAAGRDCQPADAGAPRVPTRGRLWSSSSPAFLQFTAWKAGVYPCLLPGRARVQPYARQAEAGTALGVMACASDFTAFTCCFGPDGDPPWVLGVMEPSARWFAVTASHQRRNVSHPPVSASARAIGVVLVASGLLLIVRGSRGSDDGPAS